MNIASTSLLVRETKEDAMLKVNAANNASNNGADTNAHSNAAVAQSKVVKTDIVELSQKSVELATTTQSDSGLQVAITKETYKADKKIAAKQAMQQNQQELKGFVKSLNHAGVSKDEVKSIIKTANRAVNKTIGKEVKQAYKDVLSNKITQQSYEDKLYGAAVKKLDSIVSALRDALAQKEAPADKNTEAVKERANVTKSTDAAGTTGETRVTDANTAAKANAQKSAEAVKENANATKSTDAAGTTGETRPTDADAAAKANAQKSAEAAKEAANKTSEKEVKTENKNIVKAEKTEEKEEGSSNSGKGKGLGIGNGNGIFGSRPGSINANEKADKAFGQLVSFFNNIDKMINGFADKAEGKGNDEDKSNSLLDFASKLSDMFSGINKTFGKQSREETLGHKLGVAQIDKGTIGQLFDNGHGSGAINRISDAGEGTGNFNTASFMSSISSGINDALESYKDIQRAEKEAKEEAAKEESKEAVGVLA